METKIFFEVDVFSDEDGEKQSWGKITESEIDGEIFVFIPETTGEIYPDVLDRINEMVKKLNSQKEANESQ